MTLESRVTALEQELANLKRQLEHDRMMAGIQRGMEAANAGRMAPAREVLEELRQKHKIPRA